MDPLLSIIERDLLGQLGNGTLCSRVGGGIMVCDESLDGRGVDDPAFVFEAWERGLVEHLDEGVFAAEEDGFDVDGDGFVPVGFAELVDAVRAGVGCFYGDAGVVCREGS